jgi:hypothetical protein
MAQVWRLSGVIGGEIRAPKCDKDPCWSTLFIDHDEGDEDMDVGVKGVFGMDG